MERLHELLLGPKLSRNSCFKNSQIRKISIFTVGVVSIFLLFSIYSCRDKTIKSDYQLKLSSDFITNTYSIEFRCTVSSTLHLNTVINLEFDLKGDQHFQTVLHSRLKDGMNHFQTNLSFGVPGNFTLGVRLIIKDKIEALSFHNAVVPLHFPVPDPKYMAKAFYTSLFEFGWSKVEFADNYKVQIASDHNFKKIILDEKIKINKYSITKQFPVDQYYSVRIKALNKKYPSRYNDYFSFAVIKTHMVKIEGAEFMMGKPENRIGTEDEMPVHKVKLDTFLMDIYEVSIANYALYLNCQKNLDHYHLEMADESTCGIIKRDNEFHVVKGRENFPIVYVNYYDAKSYASWRNVYLPTEAQWEYAAKGRAYKAYSFNPVYYDKAPIGESKYKTIQIDSFPEGRSLFGLYNVCGNVWEWVSDWYSKKYYSQNQINYENPRGYASGKTKVLRSGSVGFETYKARLTYRDHDYPGTLSKYIGFRCAGFIRELP